MRQLLRRLTIVALFVLGLTAPAMAPQAFAQGVAADDMILGRANAPVTVIEYASLSCPHCAAWNKEVWPAFKAKYVDTGKVRYVFREFITSPPQLAAGGALLARCAGKDKFFGVVDGVFAAQPEIYAKGDLRGPFLAVAAKAGMNEDRMMACLTDQEAMKALYERIEGYANNEGIAATPTFVINGQKLEGEQPLAALDAAIAKAQAGK